MHKPLLVCLCSIFAATALAAGPPTGGGNADDSLRAQTTRPLDYKPLAGDAKLGAQLWKDPKLSTNGMSCVACHANHGAFQASFAKPYPHTVQMAKEQLGHKVVHLDEMIQACMVMPMAAKPLSWNSKELSALVAYARLEQKSFQVAAGASATSAKKRGSR